MTQSCRVCSHPDRKSIDRQILSSGNLSELSRKLGISYDSLWRHKRDHIGGAAAAGVRKSTENHGVRLLEDLDDLVITARRILREAEADGHRVTSLKAVKEVRSSILAIAQISHAIWEQQNKEQQTIIIQEQQKEQKDWIKEGLKVLTPEEHKEYRRLNIKLLAAQGGNFPEDEVEPPDPSVDPEDLGEGDRPILTVSTDQNFDSAGELVVDPRDHSLKPQPTPRKKQEMRRTTPRK